MKKIILSIIIIIIIVIGLGIFAYFNLLKVEKYIVEKDIKDAKFIAAQMDIQGGCKMVSNFCFAYFGHYKLEYKDIKIPIEVIVEQPFKKITEDDVFSVLKDKFLVGLPEKGDWMRNYFLGGIDNDGRFVLGWNSGLKLIIIRASGGAEEADYLEDFLTEYINKYPSNIKSN